MTIKFEINEKTWIKHFGTKPIREVAALLDVSPSFLYQVLQTKAATKNLAKKLYQIDPEFLTHTITITKTYKSFTTKCHVVKKPFSPEDLQWREV